MKKETLALGIDLGGSKIYAVVTDSSHQVLADAKTATKSGGTPAETVEAMKMTAQAAVEKLNIGFDQVRFFGAAVPAPVDPVSGDCMLATNLGWDRTNLRLLLNESFGHEFTLGNDANLGQAAEHICGAAQGFHSSVGFFVGTGLGSGIILNDHLLIGHSGIAGELGHVVVEAGGRRCGCGKRGCLEAYCSKKAFVKALKKEIFKNGGETLLPAEKFNRESVNIKSKFLLRAYTAGDPSVRCVVNKGFRMLGIAAANICATLDPECIVLGGGVVESFGALILPAFRTAFESHLFGTSAEHYEVRLSALGDASVAVGATVLARGLVR